MENILPSREDFIERARPGRVVSVAAELYTDTETPISVFKKVCEPSEFAFLLESVEMEEKIGRYSFLGLSPRTTFSVRDKQVEIVIDGKPERLDGDPIRLLNEWISRYQPEPVPGLPRFQCGLVGYFGYDTIRWFEDIPNTKSNPLDLPDCFLMVADRLIVFDHVKHTVTVLVSMFVEEDSRPEELYETALERISWIMRRMGEIVLVPQRLKQTSGAADIQPVSNTAPDEFEDMVLRAKEYIHKGDIFQVVLSQRFSTGIKGDPFNVYRALRRVNPSPYMFYLKLGDLKVAGSSPEVLVRVENGTVVTRPLAGTRPRGATPEADRALETELLADPKERAEHVMLVDLGRNDLGRICKYGTVHVTEQMAIERYSHVMHIVSNVEGELQEGIPALDVLGACFPAGTVSGAPKVRAMQIIDELEKETRSIYAGAVGYIDFSGNLDFCIAIRTIVIKGQTAYLQAGAGIVADSDPKSEYRETINKSRALLRAIEQTQEPL